jgi:hypothetical protein
VPLLPSSSDGLNQHAVSLSARLKGSPKRAQGVTLVVAIAIRMMGFEASSQFVRLLENLLRCSGHHRLLR